MSCLQLSYWVYPLLNQQNCCSMCWFRPYCEAVWAAVVYVLVTGVLAWLMPACHYKMLLKLLIHLLSVLQSSLCSVLHFHQITKLFHSFSLYIINLSQHLLPTVAALFRQLLVMTLVAVCRHPICHIFLFWDLRIFLSCTFVRSDNAVGHLFFSPTFVAQVFEQPRKLINH